MNKSWGRKNFINLQKNKGKKKPKYPDHRNKCSLHKPLRQFMSSYINHNINDRDMLEDIYISRIDTSTYTWWDCRPWKPKAY